MWDSVSAAITSVGPRNCFWQGEARIFRKSNFSLTRHFHSEGGQLLSRAAGRKKLLQLLQSTAWRRGLPCLGGRRQT